MTSETADLSIVAGDFNTEPTDLPYKVIIHNAGLVDSYLTQKGALLVSYNIHIPVTFNFIFLSVFLDMY